ncbi:hypothetical protein GUY61_23005 [Streptomyces sp. GC420]|nr:hypothetical protein [Streptomyces sp. GC420]
MGIDHGVANLERHVTGTPSVAIHPNTRTASTEWRFRRSGHISGLDNNAGNVLRGVDGRRYSQVGAAVRRGRNAHVTHTARPEPGPNHPDMTDSER